MKVLETLLFMLRNPIPFIVHLMWWFSFAALGVVLDDPFVETVLPRVVQITEPPLSIGDLTTVTSIVVADIFEDIMRHGLWILVVIPPFIISYREARGNLKGMAKEHQVWTRRYRQQQEAMVVGRTFEEFPPLSLENM